MRQRFHVAWAPTFSDAVSAKHFALVDEPETNFQIRRRKNRFELVKRLAVKGAKEIQQATQYTKKKKKPRKGWGSGRYTSTDT